MVNWVLAGFWCGLSAYTYLAIRAFPILLALWFLWILAYLPARSIRESRRPALRGRLSRLAQIGLLVLAAAVVFGPLGAFYARNPEFFATRMGQVSVFAERGGGSDPWAAFWHAVRVSFALFTVRGDLNWRFNVEGAPALWWPLAICFYGGLVVGFWRLARSRSALQRGVYYLLLLWLPVMLVPSILGGGDVQVSLSLRAIGVMPALFYWPALGVVEGATFLGRALARPLGRRAGQWAAVGLVVVLLGATAVHSFHQVFDVWGPSVAGYYAASGYLVEAAQYLNENLPPDANVYFSAEHYRHPTIALLAQRYTDLKWLVGPDVLAFPRESQQETWYVFTHEAMPSEETLARFLGAPAERHQAPDGRTAFLVYRFAAGEVPIPQPQVAQEANLDNVLRFLGYDLNAPPISGDNFAVTLYFEVQREVERDDWTFFAHLTDDLGFQWGGQTFFPYPSLQWRPGEVLALRSAFPIWSGAPPQSYTLDLGVFSPSIDARLPVLNEREQMAGTTVHAGPFALRPAVALPKDLPPIQQPIQASFGPSLSLLGFDRDRGDLRPGETLALSLYWQTAAPIDHDYLVSLWLDGPDGPIPLWQDRPVHGTYPFTQWQAPTFLRDRYALRLPTDTPPGDLDLRLALLRPDGTPLPTDQGAENLLLSTLHVQATDRLWEPPPFEHPVGARLGQMVELLGYDLDPQQARHGDTVHLTLVWRCLEEMEVSYTVFTHLLDQEQQIRGQQDNPPRGGHYPTTLWVPGEVVVDEYQIEVQADAPVGTHVIEVGMYDPANLQRLPVLDPTGAAGDRVLLGGVEILR